MVRTPNVTAATRSVRCTMPSRGRGGPDATSGAEQTGSPRGQERPRVAQKPVMARGSGRASSTRRDGQRCVADRPMRWEGSVAIFRIRVPDPSGSYGLPAPGTHQCRRRRGAPPDPRLACPFAPGGRRIDSPRQHRR
jgi:hypothetical protein